MLCGLQYFIVVLDVVEQYDKFVTTNTGQCVSWAQYSLKALGDLNEQLVPGTMTKAVVDGFKTIQIQIAKSKALVCICGFFNGLRQFLLQVYAVWQAGQAVMVRLVTDGRFFFTDFRNIADHPYKAGNFMVMSVYLQCCSVMKLVFIERRFTGITNRRQLTMQLRFIAEQGAGVVEQVGARPRNDFVP